MNIYRCDYELRGDYEEWYRCGFEFDSSAQFLLKTKDLQSARETALDQLSNFCSKQGCFFELIDVVQSKFPTPYQVDWKFTFGLVQTIEENEKEQLRFDRERMQNCIW